MDKLDKMDKFQAAVTVNPFPSPNLLPPEQDKKGSKFLEIFEELNFKYWLDTLLQ